MLKNYLKEIYTVAGRGDDREESYYSTLEKLLKEYAASKEKRAIQITTLPKKTEAGNPDFRVWDGKQHIVGYIEAKAPTTKNLDDIEQSAQIKRYLHTFPNVLLTNFFDFRLYRNGILTDDVQVARPFIMFKAGALPPVENESKIYDLLEKFFSFFHINKKKGWSIRKAWNMLQSVSDDELKKCILPILYRPFDIQWIFYHDSVVWRPVKKIMYNMAHGNLGLISVRQVAERTFNHVLISNSIIESRVTLSNKGIAFLFPLYNVARKPQAFKPGDEWRPERSQRSWRSGGKSGIIWLWPDMPQELIQSIGCNIIWYGYQNIGSECFGAK